MEIKMSKIKPEVSAKLSQSARAGIEMTAVALPAFWSVIQLFSWWKPPLNTIVFAVMLGVMLPRAMKRVQLSEIHYAIAAFAAGTAAAAGCGMLIENDNGLRVLGGLLFAVAVALPVWTRRFGDAWKAPGTVFTIPFMAILVHPLPLEQNAAYFGWMLAAAAIALLWTIIVKILSSARDIPITTEPDQVAIAKPQAIMSSTKMAIQLAVAVAAAFACAELVDANHLVWPVLTVLIVHSGNNGRGDLLWKGAQRTAGALIGVTAASFIAINLPPKNSIEIVAIFGILVFAAAVREFGYIFWAACIPAALVFLYSFFGQTGAELTIHLAHRLLGIAIGSAVGIISGYFILPVRMIDVVRLRLSKILSIACDIAITSARGKTDEASIERLRMAKDELLHFKGAAKAARYLGVGAARRLHGAVNGAYELASHIVSGDIPKGSDDLAALAKEIGVARRSLSSEAAGANNTLTDHPDQLIAYVQAIVTAKLNPKKSE